MSRLYSATDVANNFNSTLKAKDINSALVKLKYMKKVATGYIPVSDFGILKERDGYTFCVWKEELLKDDSFLKSLNIKNESNDDSYDEKYLSATQISKAINFPSKEVNDALVNSGFSEKTEGGYKLIKKMMGKDMLYEGTKPYILWKDGILKNEKFLINLEKVLKKPTTNKSTSDAAKISNKKVTSTNKKFTDEEKKYFDIDSWIWYKRFYIKLGELQKEGNQAAIDKHMQNEPQLFQATSGHWVRSKAELLMANYMQQLGMVFSYELRVTDLLDNVLSDFYVEFKYEDDDRRTVLKRVYIELWGFENNPKYSKRKEIKQGLYGKTNHILVEFDDKTVSQSIHSIFELTFLRHKDFDLSLKEMILRTAEYRNKFGS